MSENAAVRCEPYVWTGDASTGVEPPAPASGATSGAIVAVLPRGEALRNFVDSGTLDVVGAHADLTVLTVIPSDDVQDQLKARFARVLPLKEIRERYPVRILRDILDLAHGRQLWSAAAQERWRLRDAEAVTFRQKLKRRGRKVASSPFASRRGIRALELTERFASRVLCNTDEYLTLYRRLCPTLVFNGSHVHSRNAIQAVQAAQWLGIPTAAFIFSWDNLTSQGRVIPGYDYYIVWNDDLRRQLLAIYPAVHAEQVFVTGTPQFDFHFRPESHWPRDAFCRRVGADPDRPIVLYSTGMAEHMPGEPALVEQIADTLRGMPELGPAQLLVRVYPKDRTGRFESLKKERGDILFPEARWVDAWLTPTGADTRMLTNTIRHVDAGINVASTVSLELCMFDKPVINVGYDPPNTPPVRVPYARYYEYDHYRPLVESGAVQVARTPDEMPALLRDALTCPGRWSAQRRALLDRMFGDTLDGHSADRVAATLLDLARGGAQSRRRPRA